MRFWYSNGICNNVSNKLLIYTSESELCWSEYAYMYMFGVCEQRQRWRINSPESLLFIDVKSTKISCCGSHSVADPEEIWGLA